MDNAVALAALGLVGTLAGALIWLLKGLFNQNNSTLDKLSDSSSDLSSSIKELADASKQQAEAISKREAADKEWQEYVTKRFDELRKIGENIINKVDHQEVTEQTVTHQTVIHKEEK